MKFLHQIEGKKYKIKEGFEKAFDECFNSLIAPITIKMHSDYVLLREIYDCINQEKNLPISWLDFLENTIKMMESEPEKYYAEYRIVNDWENKPIIKLIGVRKLPIT